MYTFSAPTLIQYPTGSWGFVGRVPAALAWRREDGKPMTDRDWHAVTHCMAPGSFGYCSVAFECAHDARVALSALTGSKTSETEQEETAEAA
jgi:hypothetical protein